eukprot:11079953-Ditylum_brightwellii.AAC.1
MIDPITSWFEIVQIPVYQYHPPKKKEPEIHTDMTLAQLSQFKLHFKELCEQYGLKHKPTTKKDPQATSIPERIHQAVTNMLRSYDLKN